MERVMPAMPPMKNNTSVEEFTAAPVGDWPESIDIPPYCYHLHYHCQRVFRHLLPYDSPEMRTTPYQGLFAQIASMHQASHSTEDPYPLAYEYPPYPHKSGQFGALCELVGDNLGIGQLTDRDTRILENTLIDHGSANQAGSIGIRPHQLNTGRTIDHFHHTDSYPRQ